MLEVPGLSTQSTILESESLWSSTDFQHRIPEHCWTQTAELLRFLMWPSMAACTHFHNEAHLQKQPEAAFSSFITLPTHMNRALLSRQRSTTSKWAPGYSKLYQGWEHCKSGRKLSCHLWPQWPSIFYSISHNWNPAQVSAVLNKIPSLVSASIRLKLVQWQDSSPLPQPMEVRKK